MASKPYTIRWGILATGGIAQTFTKDLLTDPSTRDASDIKHEVVAAASSSSADRAKKFLEDTGVSKDSPSAKAYGSYKELVADKDVDIVYVATPHSHHFQNTMLCLEAGKHVLCEKAFTVNGAQARKLVQTARDKKLFLMEAVWTRYFPLSIELRKMVQGGKIGTVHRVTADLSIQMDVEGSFGTEHRMVNMDLAGGALLDLGVYPLTWLFQFIYHLQPPAERKAPKAACLMSTYAKTGADDNTSILLTFPTAPPTHGVATTTMRLDYNPSDNPTQDVPAIRIQGTKGEIQVLGPAYRPLTYRLVPGKGADFKYEEVTRDIPQGHGMHWEADECARCLRDGKLESDGLDWEESCVIMETMDECRRQNGLIYPERIESADFPLEGF